MPDKHNLNLARRCHVYSYDSIISYFKKRINPNKDLYNENLKDFNNFLSVSDTSTMY